MNNSILSSKYIYAKAGYAPGPLPANTAHRDEQTGADLHTSMRKLTLS
jgi:hypothetical protein